MGRQLNRRAALAAALAILAAVVLFESPKGAKSTFPGPIAKAVVKLGGHKYPVQAGIPCTSCHASRRK
ncbi:hypothetical protein [Fimbriimonas ginsengisoli]|uniref:Cytochrome c family protein n=1 Tax=Fimbriimonas ginsengisoli Gsoil 348 TaxID=661478 RepID=A0A068NU38_FIMGI|nr:hypothetical protein [Fimbriimonas ginsengisoli]AIE86295.1 hypothetical protein OP10G_2927 [Fimbriimonas ginsengisoli Gsoil 348]